MRYSIPNGNGTYRIPINGLNVRIESEKGGTIPAIFGELADLVGKVEDLGDIDQLTELVKKNQ